MAKKRFTNIPDTRLTAVVIIVFLLASNAEREVRNPSHAVWKSTGRSNLVEEDECCAASYFQVPNSQARPERMAFLLGAQKSGTTFLFDELTSRHPFIVSKAATAKTPQMLETKESRYFHRLPIEDLKTFLNPFAMSGDIRNSTLTFMDGTPDYLHIPSAACRIKATFPNARFIVLLRDPVSRAFSHWNMGAFFGSTKSFPFTVNDEMKQLAKAHCTFQPPISTQAGFNVTLEFLDKQGLPPAEVSGSTTKRYMADITRRGESPSNPIGSIQQGKMIRPQVHEGLEAGAGAIVQEAGEQDTKQPEPEKENVEENKWEDSTPQKRQVLLDAMSHEEAMTTLRRQAGIPSWNACFKCTFQCKNDVLKARRGDTAPGGGDVWFYCHRQFSSTALIRRGLYVYQLEWWLKLFKPEQFLIINHEELKTNPEAVISKAISFLGQDLALLQPPHHGHKEDKASENTLKFMAATTDLNNAFLSKTTSGWSLPLKDGDAVQKYNSTIEKLYKFYAHPNQELYRLLKTMGPSSGWHGEFPANLASGDFE